MSGPVSGAGKSSLFLSLADLLISRTGATVSMNGRTLTNFSFLPQHPSLPTWLTTDEMAEAFGFGIPELRERVPGFKLAEVAGKRTAHLSEGQTQALSLVLALSVDSDVAILDEPLSALDLRRRKSFREYISEWKPRATGRRLMILSTQSISEIVDFCDAVVVLHEGECRYCGTLAGLVPSTRPDAGDFVTAVENAVVSLLE